MSPSDPFIIDFYGTAVGPLSYVGGDCGAFLGEFNEEEGGACFPAEAGGVASGTGHADFFFKAVQDQL